MKNVIFLFAFFALHVSLSATSIDDFFNASDQFFSTYVIDGAVDYQAIQHNSTSLDHLIEEVAQQNLDGLNSTNRKAFLINAYNLLVIAQIVDNLPLKSPLDVAGFFDSKRFTIAGETLTLNQLEKKKLLSAFGDPRFHFVLVCGAQGCPPIIDEAYLPATLEQQMERQTRLALNDNNFIRVNGTGVGLSQIFEWYAGDFGGSKQSAVAYINKYRSTPLPSAKVSFYTYNWTLNQAIASRSAIEALPANGSNNEARYVVSAAIPKGSFEIKGFSNLYTQRTGLLDGETVGERATFYTQNLSVLYGVNNRLNVGVDAKYRQVSFGAGDDSRFAVFNLEQTQATRQGLTGFGPKVRFAPSTALPNFSIQSTYWVAIGTDLAGNNERPFIDFNGDVWFTQIFNDFSIGQNFSLFTELDILLEDIGASEDGHINRFSTPVQTIFSYFPNAKTTFYVLGSYSPYWQSDFDYFYQYGAGVKYQLNPRLEVELLHTQFRNQFILDTNGGASTLNLGVRISVF